MTDKNPLVVEPGQVVFEETSTGKKPDTLDGVFISPEALGQGNAAILDVAETESMKRVATAFRTLLAEFRSISCDTSKILSPGLDKFIPYFLQLSYGFKTHHIYREHQFTIPEKTPLTFVKNLLVDFYGQYILETDFLPKNQSHISGSELIKIFPEVNILNKLINSEFLGETYGTTISDPYLLILMAEPEVRPFLCGAMNLCEQENLLEAYRPWNTHVKIENVQFPYSLDAVIKYAKRGSITEVQKYLVEIAKLPIIKDK